MIDQMIMSIYRKDPFSLEDRRPELLRILDYRPTDSAEEAKGFEPFSPRFINSLMACDFWR